MAEMDNSLYVVYKGRGKEGKLSIRVLAVYPKDGGSYQVRWNKSQGTPAISTKDLAYVVGMIAAGGSVRFVDVAEPSAPANLLTAGSMLEVVVKGIDIRREFSGERISVEEPTKEALVAIGEHLLARVEELRADPSNIRPSADERLLSLKS